MQREMAITLVMLGGGMMALGAVGPNAQDRHCAALRQSGQAGTDPGCAGAHGGAYYYGSGGHYQRVWNGQEYVEYGRPGTSVVRGGFGAIGRAFAGFHLG